MKVGVYIDGFNLYYGGLGHFGHVPGWRWLDLRALASRFCTWQGSEIARIVYCTARVNDPQDPGQIQSQNFYLQALEGHGSIDVLEEGYYSSWATEAAMTADPPSTRAPSALVDEAGVLTWAEGLPIRRSADSTMLATIRKREEKGSDVNVATHLLVDVLTGTVDAAIVISNDSDLTLPVRRARAYVPVGLINPSRRPLAGALKGQPTDGVGRHWWRKLSPQDFWLANSQIPSRGSRNHTIGRCKDPSSVLICGSSLL